MTFCEVLAISRSLLLVVALPRRLSSASLGLSPPSALAFLAFLALLGALGLRVGLGVLLLELLERRLLGLGPLARLLLAALLLRLGLARRPRPGGPPGANGMPEPEQQLERLLVGLAPWS